jgi:thiaminase (transcriptional activator TenA)
MIESLLSDQIVAENAGVWDQMQNHRFVLDIESDRLNAKVFHKYLIYECCFVETAISIFGHLLVKSPGPGEQKVIVGILQALSEEQLAYFQLTFQQLGLDYPKLVDLELPMPVLAFQQGMLSFAAHGAYVDGVAAMFAAEWMYLNWCRKAIAKPISDPVLRQWVALHTADAFVSQATWLKREVDAAGRALGELGRQRVSRIFRSALQFEIGFHSAPYDALGI